MTVDFMELMTRDEPLDPELEPYLSSDGPMGWTVLKHPLVFQIPYHAPAWANAALRQKQAMLARYEEEGNWYGWVFAHERPYRSDALIEIAPRITDDKVYWELVGDVWVDTENPWQWGEDLRTILLADRPHREYIMDEDDRIALAAMPDEITVYRGYTPAVRNLRGWSWTTWRDKAKWFAQRFDTICGKGRVARGTVRKEDVIAFLNRRGESEILVDPQKVKVSR